MPRKTHALEIGYKLDEYIIVDVLGSGGFGITYRAIEPSLQRHVAIKEYFPEQFAERLEDNTIVAQSGEENAKTYDWGLNRFLREARTLAQFEHPNISKATRYLEANGTAYLVMKFEEGKNLETWLRDRTAPPSESEILSTILPILDGLHEVHAQGLIHRDIKPLNIMIRPDGTPVLIDFGSTRPISRTDNTALTTLISPGYSPPEQYGVDSVAQGPWTDVYAIAGVLYRIIAGQGPPDALLRVAGKEMAPAREVGLGKLNSNVLTAIDKGLELNTSMRPQSASEFRSLLLREDFQTARSLGASNVDTVPEDPQDETQLNPTSEEVQGETRQWIDEFRKVLPVGSRTPTRNRKITNRWADPGPKAVAFLLAAIAFGFMLAALGKAPFATNNVIHSWVSLFVQPVLKPVRHSFNVEPQSTTLYLNGTPIDKIIELTPGNHDIVAVKAGYFGRVVEVTVGDEPATTAVTLEPITLPTQTELGRFVSAIEAPQVMMGNMRNIIDPALRAVLELKQLIDKEDTQEAARLRQQLELLASFDDQAATVSLYLAAESEILERDSAGLLPRLHASMESGYALATFWYAIRLRDDLREERVAPGTSRHVTYCETMQRAYEQGLREIARQYLNSEDECGMLQ